MTAIIVFACMLSVWDLKNAVTKELPELMAQNVGKQGMLLFIWIIAFLVQGTRLWMLYGFLAYVGWVHP